MTAGNNEFIAEGIGRSAPPRSSPRTGRRAATSIEYALVAALLSIVILSGVMSLGVALGEQYDAIAAAVDSVF